MKGAVFISDERMRYASLALKEAGYEIVEAEDAESGRALLLTDPLTIDFLVAPIRGAEDGRMTLKGESFEVDSFLRGLDPKVPVITGFISPYMKQLPLNIISFQKDDTFANANGALTAEGVLLFMISKTKRSIFEYTYDIVGTGRAGTKIKELLSKLNLNIRTVSHKEEVESITVEEWQQLQPADVVINTAPVIPENLMNFEKWQKKVVVIDISSMRKKDAGSGAQFQNAIYYAAPPLPGLVAPESAGILLAEFVKKKMIQGNVASL